MNLRVWAREEILTALRTLSQRGVSEPDADQIARCIRAPKRALIFAYGMFYPALDDMVTDGLLTTRWDPDDDGPAFGHPRRRLYGLRESA